MHSFHLSRIFENTNIFSVPSFTEVLMKSIFVFIAPYEEMAVMAEEVARELKLDGWVFDVGYGESGLQLAERYYEQGAKLIVSRNMTALAISRHLSIPVIDLSASPYDIVKGLSHARKFGTRIGVIGPADLVYGCRALGEPFGLEVSEWILSDLEQLPETIQQAKQLGIEIMLGGQNEIQCAISYGINGVLLYTGKSTIASAMKRAVDLYQLQYSERLRAEQIRTILDHSYEGILATDGNGQLILMNLTARSMLGTDQSTIGHSIQTYMPFLPSSMLHPESDATLGGIYELNGSRIMIHSRMVCVDGKAEGTVLTLQYVKDITEMEGRARKENVMRGHVAGTTLDDISTCSENMQRLIAQARRYAMTNSTVLITGETGTGKEMLAQGIHIASLRKNGPFVAINCASIPENLLESELFGYEEGAFTGARRNGKKGYFELANKGTLFLDEIGEIPLNLQANLLRVLQEKQIMRVGGDRIIPIDVRIIAATHRDLQKAVSGGKFRLDLFYRLNVLRLMIPPLRERPDDIPLLVRALIRKKSKQLSLPPVEIPEEGMTFFRQNPWKGNVRELENLIERLCIVCNGSTVTMQTLREVLPEFQSSPPGPSSAAAVRSSQRAMIEQALEAAHWRRADAAKLLGISTTTLWRRMREYGIDISFLKS